MSSTPGAVDEATATTFVCLLLSTMRRFSMCEAHLRAGGFAPIKQVEESAHDLSGKTVGILGMGGIGSTFVNYIRAFLRHEDAISQSKGGPRCATGCDLRSGLARWTSLWSASL